MATAGQVVKAILQEIVELASEAPLEPPETSDTVFAMNNYMTELDADGVSLGYTVVSSLNQTLTVPDGAINGIIKNVALSMSSQFDAVVTQELARQAANGRAVMTKLATLLSPMNFPCTLPIGSGNEWADSSDWNGQHFYPCDEALILDEQNNNILLENETNES